MYLCKIKMSRYWYVQAWINRYCYFNLLILKYLWRSLLLLPAVTSPLHTGNIRIWPTRTEHTRVQPVVHRCDLPSSAKWSTLSLVVTAWHLELTKVFYIIMLLLIALKKAHSLQRQMNQRSLLKLVTLRVVL